MKRCGGTLGVGACWVFLFLSLLFIFKCGTLFWQILSWASRLVVLNVSRDSTVLCCNVVAL